MVVALGPGKFYGSSLPRPRIYNDVKLNDERVDPPVPVLDPLLSWAEEAHWSMGGLSFKRLRLQGRIEGNVQKLKKEKEKIMKKRRKNQSSTPNFQSQEKSSVAVRNRVGNGGERVDSPPPAPISKKRRLRSMLVDEDDNDVDEYEGREMREERGNGGVRKKRRKLVRKLGDDFELVASDNGKNNGGISEGMALRTRSRRSMVLPEEEDESDEGENSKNQKKSEKPNEGRGSVPSKGVSKKSGEKGSGTPSKLSKNNGEKVSVSPLNGTRSSPRLKQK